MKKHLLIIAAVFIFIYLASCRKLNPIIPTDTLCVPCQNKVTFVDKNLEQAVRNALGKGSCDICSDDIVKVTSLSIQSQVKLLRLLDTGDYYPLGSDLPRRASARVLVATNRNTASRRTSCGCRP